MASPRLAPEAARPAQAQWLPAVIATAGFGLGCLAFVGDQIPGIAGGLIITLTSSGFAWGLAGVLAGHAARGRRASIIAASALLVVATFFYYLCVLLLSQRWRLGITADGGSTAASGLASLGVAAGFWLVASLCAGPVLGIAGQLLRSGQWVARSIVAGAVFGLLSAQGWYYLIFVPGWRNLDEFGVTILLSALAIIVLSTAATMTMIRRATTARSWVVVAVAALLMSGMALALWHEMEAARRLLGV